MKLLKLVTFDVVNTIIRVKGSPGHQYAKVANLHGIAIRAEDINNVYKDIWYKKKAEHPTYGIHHGIMPREWWDDFVRKVFIKAGFNGDSELLGHVSGKIWSHYELAEDCYDVLPHSHEVLGAIQSQGYKLGVISNFDERLPVTLNTLNLSKYFDFQVTSVTAYCSKPGKKIFEEALKLGNVTARQCLHIGDDVKEDYYGAKEVGINAVLLDRENKITDTSIPKEHILSDVKDVLNVLGKFD